MRLNMIEGPASGRGRCNDRRLRYIRSCMTVLIACAACVSTEIQSAEPIQIGSQRELFVDHFLIDSLDDSARLVLHQPTPQEVVLTFDQPWEGNASGYPTVFQDGDLYRMYYRGHRYVIDDPPFRQAQSEAVCYAESHDGIHWTKPNLGIHKWPGVEDNNIIWMGSPEAHNFAPYQGYQSRLFARATLQGDWGDRDQPRFVDVSVCRWHSLESPE